MISIYVSVIFAIRLLLLVVATLFFGFGAALSWWECTQNRRNGITRTLGRFSLSSAIVFLTTAILAGVAVIEAALYTHFHLPWVIAITGTVSVMALIDMNRSAYYLALELFKLDNGEKEQSTAVNSG